MKLSITVMAHPARADQAKALANQVGASIAFDYGKGQNVTGDFAWRLGLSVRSADWVIVLEDDAVPIPGFRKHAEAALAHIPQDSLISFYTGTGQPRPEKVAKAVAEADAAGNAWLECDALLWGVAVALPAGRVPEMLESVVTHPDTRYDTRLSNWAYGIGLPIFYTNPSLVDHADGPSLIHRPGQRPPRRAHRVGTPDSWFTPATRITARFDT